MPTRLGLAGGDSFKSQNELIIHMGLNDAMVAVLLGTDRDADQILLNDMYGDGVVNGADIDEFLAALPDMSRDRATRLADLGRIAAARRAALVLWGAKC
ncbi:MAG: hypothetical protein O7B26_08005 [Planctomycetota bacterium]|nr:hypothetical protein [Planctomycetota bacterium]